MAFCSEGKLAFFMLAPLFIIKLGYVVSNISTPFVLFLASSLAGPKLFCLQFVNRLEHDRVFFF